jgi:uncharacterized protein (TIGR03435 family)
MENRARVSWKHPAASAVGGASNPGGWHALVPDAVREQPGLRLVHATGPGDVLVIESIQRPSEN